MTAGQDVPSRTAFKRGLVVVLLVAAAIVAGVVWLLTRADGSEYGSPTEAVRAACPVDPGGELRDMSTRPPNTGPYQSSFSVKGFAVVAWTAKDAPHDQRSALVRQLADGKWRVAACQISATLDR